MRNQSGHKNTCPKCGAAMKLLEVRAGKKLVCDYCGYETAAVRELTEEERAREREVMRARAKQEAAAAAKRKTRRILLALAAAAAVLLITAAIIRSNAKKTIDPFDYVSVTFVGGNGKGEAELHVRESERVDTSQIRYILSKSYGLSEGEEIEIKAESDAYLLSARKQSYTVSGLDTYLTDLDFLSDKAIAAIHARSEEVNLRNRERSPQILHDCVYCKPTIMYLLTDGKNRNLLYDVYEAGFSMENDEIYHVYLVTYYENIIVRDTDEGVSIDFGRCFYDGKELQFGESIFHMSMLSGYETLEEIEKALLTNRDSSMELKQRNTTPQEEEKS